MQVLTIAAAGLTRALGRFEASAVRTAQLADPNAEVDYAEEAVEQISAKHEVSANLAVIRTADEMLGELLDIKA
jgi:flagellar hook protein FlgE